MTYEAGDRVICNYAYPIRPFELTMNESLADHHLDEGEVVFKDEYCYVVAPVNRSDDILVEFDCGSRIRFNSQWVSPVPPLVQLAQAMEDPNE